MTIPVSVVRATVLFFVLAGMAYLAWGGRELTEKRNAWSACARDYAVGRLADLYAVRDDKELWALPDPEPEAKRRVRVILDRPDPCGCPPA